MSGSRPLSRLGGSGSASLGRSLRHLRRHHEAYVVTITFRT
jgi:hypothetical protein